MTDNTDTKRSSKLKPFATDIIQKNETAQKAHKTWQMTDNDDDNFQSIN